MYGKFAVGGPLEASTCGGSHKPCRSFSVGVKGWRLADRLAVDHPGPTAARNALLVTDGHVDALFVHKIRI